MRYYSCLVGFASVLPTRVCPCVHVLFVVCLLRDCGDNGVPALLGLVIGQCAYMMCFALRIDCAVCVRCLSASFMTIVCRVRIARLVLSPLDHACARVARWVASFVHARYCSCAWCMCVLCLFPNGNLGLWVRTSCCF